MIQSIGWNPLSATQWRTSRGDILDLLSLPPTDIFSHDITALCRNMSDDYAVDWEIATLVLVPPKRLRERLELSSEAPSTHPVLRLTLSQRRWFQALLEGNTWTHAGLAQTEPAMVLARCVRLIGRTRLTDCGTAPPLQKFVINVGLLVMTRGGTSSQFLSTSGHVCDLQLIGSHGRLPQSKQSSASRVVA